MGETITVFEHDTIHWDRGSKRLSQPAFHALEAFFGTKGVPYFSLCHNGIRFNEYVGVIQVGNFIIEILPKADKNITALENTWRNILIGMLKAAGNFPITAASQSSLRLKNNSILELYFELFIAEVEYLCHQGLAKKYRTTEGNLLALKGSLRFSKHIQHNLCHQERFYVRHSTYDQQHLLHHILFKCLCLIDNLNINPLLISRIKNLLLDFPEGINTAITSKTFDRLTFNRRTENYKKAIEIAKLLLLQYHPDIRGGRNHVLALMFDMNLLWERFVYVSLQKFKPAKVTINPQQSKHFWQPELGSGSSLRPDIIIRMQDGETIVLDTKWKNLFDYNPSLNDLRQMFVYHEYFHATKVSLVYPGTHTADRKGRYFDKLTSVPGEMECSIIGLKIEKNIHQWQKAIADKIFGRMVLKKSPTLSEAL